MKNNKIKNINKNKNENTKNADLKEDDVIAAGEQTDETVNETAEIESAADVTGKKKRSFDNLHFDFVGKFKIFLIVSACIFSLGIIMNIVFGTDLAIEFRGGATISYSYTGTIDTAAVAESVKTAINQDVTVTTNEDYTTHAMSLTITMPGNKTLSTDEISKISTTITEKFPHVNAASQSVNSVDATIGANFFQKAMYVIALAAVFVVLYVGFRFRKIGGLSAGIMALIGLFHDMFVVYFIYVIFRIPLDVNFIAVVLTILGYSLNDNIVIYDRIRENRRLHGAKNGIRPLVNLSINQSFRRSCVTVFVVFVAATTIFTVAEYRGLTSIISFALPMMFGVVSGAYSSICLAGPLWVFWRERQDKKLALNQKSGKSGKSGSGKGKPAAKKLTV